MGFEADSYHQSSPLGAVRLHAWREELGHGHVGNLVAEGLNEERGGAEGERFAEPHQASRREGPPERRTEPGAPFILTRCSSPGSPQRTPQDRISCARSVVSCSPVRRLLIAPTLTHRGVPRPRSMPRRSRVAATLDLLAIVRTLNQGVGALRSGALPAGSS